MVTDEMNRKLIYQDGHAQKKTAVPVEEVQEQQFIEKISLDSLKNQKQEYLSLAKKFRVSLSSAIAHYDTLSKPDT